MIRRGECLTDGHLRIQKTARDSTGSTLLANAIALKFVAIRSPVGLPAFSRYAISHMNSTRPVALITGAARRVGQAIALHLADQGFDIAFTYHSSRPQAMELCDTLAGRGARALAIEANLLDPNAAAGQIAAQLSPFSTRLNALINNASLYEPDNANDLQQPRRMWTVHVEAPLRLAQSLRSTLAGSGGCIINMVDILAQRPMPGHLSYCASKAALANLTLGLARELAPDIRVCGIAPGIVDWPDAMPQEERECYLKRVPLRRAGTPQDVARLVHFLLTGGAYITAQIITLDGGRSIA